MRASARLMRAQGNSYQQIADALGVSRRSVIYWCNEAEIR
ncbi:MAG: helix-turn-helix domain-containing protein [Candidatus Thermoplasmatota archaeon]|nr:helix-turn-helix domain-containing protein [Candidatus Thermoplasmatota archaeon]